MDRTAYDRFFELEEKHFWRIAKRRLVLDWLDRHGPAPGGLRLLDIGGACSLIPRELQRWGSVMVIEADADTANFARERLALDVRPGIFPKDMPTAGPFDVITMCDVLEHIEDDS
ncbi:class I SAM-dependent methyltransferase, partial [candidate division WOR-3 bacterium]|nr:class I SAM-dependent methyltransferase [candidate division WOR-3 bacterium]